MMKNLKYLSVLFSSALILAGCGTADTGNEVETPDTEKPFVSYILPSTIQGSGKLGLNETAIIIKLSEAITTDAVEKLNSTQIISTTGTVLAGQWTLDNNTHELAFTFENTPLPSNQTFHIVITDEIKDIAGNILIDGSFSFSTTKLYSISVAASAQSLASDESIVVTQTIPNPPDGYTPQSITLTSDSRSGDIDSRLESGKDYILSIDSSPSGKFCSLSKSFGTVGIIDPSITISCHDVVPYYAEGPLWNNYLNVSTTDTPEIVHAGEYRAVLVNGINSCDGVEAFDSLTPGTRTNSNLFNWSCEVVEGETDQIKVFSTGLQKGKGLSDLINFSTSPSWKNIALFVKNSSGTIVKETIPGPWWNNPVLITPDTSMLTIKDAVYAHADKNGAADDSRQNFVFAASGISLVIDPKKTLYTQNGGIRIDKPSYYFWLEGKINGQNDDKGISINNNFFGRIHNLKLTGTKSNGITIIDTQKVVLSNVSVTNVQGSGLVLNETNFTQPGAGIEIYDSIFSYNTQAGITLDVSNALLSGINTSSNLRNGVNILGNGNTILMLNASNNVMNGIKFSGAQNNLLSQLTVTNNHNNGIAFDADSDGTYTAKSNNIQHATIANNVLQGIAFNSSTLSTDDIDSNKLNNILDAYNAASNCTQCSNILTITTDDLPLESAFVGITLDSNVPNHNNPNLTASAYISDFPILENSYRTWGNKNAATATAGSGSCLVSPAVTCEIYDWTLSMSNNLALDTQTTPDIQLDFSLVGGGSLQHLELAMEINTDDIGNNNGFCEANETCIIARNFGNYQGHSSLSDFSSDSATVANMGITLKQFSDNGY